MVLLTVIVGSQVVFLCAAWPGGPLAVPQDGQGPDPGGRDQAKRLGRLEGRPERHEGGQRGGERWLLDSSRPSFWYHFGIIKML